MNPREAERKFEKGLQADQQGNYEGALVSYEECLELNPEHLEAQINYAGTLMSLDRCREALPLLKDLYSRHPNGFTRMGLMEALRRLKEWDELRKVAQQAVDQDYTDYAALNSLGWATRYQGNYSQASSFFLRAIEENENFYSAWLGLGYSTLYLRQLDEAIKAFSSALSVESVPPNPPELDFEEALFGLGLAYLAGGVGEKALGIGNWMASGNYSRPETTLIRARALFCLGRDEAGIQEGELAVSQGVTNPYLLLDMAFAYAHNEDGSNALRLLSLIDKDEAPLTLDDYEIGCALSSVFLILGHHDDAIAETLELIENFGEDENLLNMLGVMHQLRDGPTDKLKSRTYYDRALKYSRDDLTLSNRAFLLDQAGATREAIDLTREAVQVAKTAPRSPFSPWSVTMNLATLTAKLGDITGAKRLLKELLEDESIPDWAIMRAKHQLNKLDEGTAGGEGPGALPSVSGRRYAEAVQREERITVRLFERLVCDKCKEDLGWHSCEAAYTVPGISEIGDLDVYGSTAERDGPEIVCVGECKLRFENETLVSHGEVNQLAQGKLKPLQEFMDAQGDTRLLRGFFFANADYDEDARKLASREGIQLFKVRLSRDWRYRDDWGIRLQESEV